MKVVARSSLALTCLGILTAAAAAAGQYHEVTYPPATQAGELQVGVTYTVWIPDGVSRLRGVIVHQHGCGAPACKGGQTAAYDLHWQALAQKWDCALLGPSYHQDDKQNCRLWSDPRNGSAKTFLKALAELGDKSKHPELESVPWSLGPFRRRLLGQPDADQVSRTHRCHLVTLRDGLCRLGEGRHRKTGNP